MATKKPLHEESTGKDALKGNSRKVAADITERKGAEERIAVFRSFVEASGQGFGMADLDRRISYVNPEFCRLMGEERLEDVVGGSFKQYYTEESQQKLEDEVIPAVLEEGQWVGELTVVSTKGILTPTIATCFLMRDEKGDPLYLANVSTDIKERKRAEEALRESDKRLRLTLNAVSDGGWDWNVSTGEVFYSDRWLESLGYKSDEVESHISFWESIVHPDDMPRIREALNAHFEGHTPYFECENRLRTKSGEYRWNLDRGRVVARDAGGKPLRMVGTDTDITERKRAEEEVTNLSKFPSENPHPVLRINADGTVLYANAAAEPLLDSLGSEVGKVLPAEWNEVNTDALGANARRHTDVQHDQNIFSFEVVPVSETDYVNWYGRNVTKRRQAEKALHEAHDQLEERVERRTTELAMANTRLKQEAEERRRAEEALRDSEEQFRTLFESTNDAVMLLDENQFFECNAATLSLFGCSTRDQFIGKRPSELSPPMQPDGTDSRTAAKAKITLAIETGIAQFEWLHCRVDGVEFFADVLLSSLQLKGRTVLQAVVRDISERKRAEEAVLRERETLRRLLGSSDRDRKLTAYEIHDGLAQHIAGAKMQLEASSQLKEENPEAAAQAYERGMKLLAWGMGEARRLISGLRPPILDEAGVVAAIEHLVNESNIQKGPEVSFVFKGKFGRLEPLLENAIFRIVQESVTNALRYSESRKVQIRLTQKDSLICIEVQDGGVGFDPTEIAETSFGIGGIRERARLLGGQATIDSTPGKGTFVRVELPLVESE